MQASGVPSAGIASGDVAPLLYHSAMASTASVMSPATTRFMAYRLLPCRDRTGRRKRSGPTAAPCRSAALPAAAPIHPTLFPNRCGGPSAQDCAGIRPKVWQSVELLRLLRALGGHFPPAPRRPVAAPWPELRLSPGWQCYVPDESSVHVLAAPPRRRRT